jgi:DNA invertase Pin-like site-specific DNA recombinase
VSGQPCSVTGCDGSAAALGLCTAHYRRWRRHGDTRSDLPIRHKAPATEVDIDRAARLYRAGASTQGIARLLGTTRTAIHNALRQADIPIRSSKTRTSKNSTQHQ